MSFRLCEGTQLSKHLFARGKGRNSPSLLVSLDVALALLPFGIPEPCLCGINNLLRPKEDPLGRDFNLKEIAILEVSGSPDIVWKGDLPSCSKRCSGHHPTLPAVTHFQKI